MKSRALTPYFLAFLIHFTLSLQSPDHRPKSSAETHRHRWELPDTPFPHFWGPKLLGSGGRFSRCAKAIATICGRQEGTDFQYVASTPSFMTKSGCTERTERGQPLYKLLLRGPVLRITGKRRAHGGRNSASCRKYSRPPGCARLLVHAELSPAQGTTRWDNLIRSFARHLV
jgi:hypothetical protein